MHAIMLAAGRGMRLSGGSGGLPPKSLLRFGGKSLRVATSRRCARLASIS
jgi:choline kinase